MSVIGYDFGNLNSYIAVARHGGIDVLTNDYSLHATPSCVSFGPKSRVMGVAARQQVNTNFKNTILNFKHFLGQRFSDPVVEVYKKFVPCEVVQLPEDQIGLKVKYLGEDRILTPEQVTAAFLVKLKDISEQALNSKVHECVIAVPHYFTESQRHALFSAARIANLNMLEIVNENTAVGIAYGIYKGSSLPVEKDPSKIVAFVDIGHSAAQASLMAFNERKVAVLGATYDLTAGGLFFDEIIREHFHQLFLEKYKIDAKTNPRAWLRLLDECEKLKKQMSANSTAIPIAIECFMDDKDVSGSMQRDFFEELAAPIFEKIRVILAQLIEQTGVKIEDVSEVELIGGSSRIPFIKQIVAHFFNREPKTTMNQDEAVARGTGMQCAILSHNCKVKEFTVVELPKEETESKEPPNALSLEEYIKFEIEMQRIDLNNKLTADAKNAVEEYCYGMRDQLSESLASYVTQEEVEKFQSLLVETEEWLYGDGEEADRAMYEKKLEELRTVIETPIRKREQEEKRKRVEAETALKAAAAAKARAEAAEKAKIEEAAKAQAAAEAETLLDSNGAAAEGPIVETPDGDVEMMNAT